MGWLTRPQVGRGLFSAELSWLWRFSSHSIKAQISLYFFFLFFFFPRHVAHSENLGRLKCLEKCDLKYHNIKRDRSFLLVCVSSFHFWLCLRGDFFGSVFKSKLKLPALY